MLFRDPNCTVPAHPEAGGGFESRALNGTSGSCQFTEFVSIEHEERCEGSNCWHEMEEDRTTVAFTAFCGGPSGTVAFEYNHGRE